MQNNCNMTKVGHFQTESRQLKVRLDVFATKFMIYRLEGGK